ncbi:uncharacterized protein LOC110757302 [Prunus avium]|uniref:Uncharacterized protein LOC110757302 n=1 Tax=Prunus avium TaxID=42229 RepID=A0A6P5SCE4_PRUAV|nr:uncharacterized protein LOC110757302 [Prunus avium]
MASVDDLVIGLSSNLAISESEAFEVVGVEELAKLKTERFLMVGRLLTTKVFHKEALIGMMKKIWHTRQKFSTVPLEDPTSLLFSFKSNFDRKKVMKRSPWTFDRALLLLAEIDGSVDPVSVPLDTQNFWVRVRRITPIFLTLAIGEQIGKYLGNFVMVDRGLNGDCLGRFLRIRVGLNVTEPLKRCVTLRLALDESAKQYEIEYERIPFFCLFCGTLNHVGSFCNLKQLGAIVYEQYGRRKTVMKEVYCIKAEERSNWEKFWVDGCCSRAR